MTRRLSITFTIFIITPIHLPLLRSEQKGNARGCPNKSRYPGAQNNYTTIINAAGPALAMDGRRILCSHNSTLSVTYGAFPLGVDKTLPVPRRVTDSRQSQPSFYYPRMLSSRGDSPFAFEDCGCGYKTWWARWHNPPIWGGTPGAWYWLWCRGRLEKKKGIAFTTTILPKKLSTHALNIFCPLNNWEEFSLHSLSFGPFQLH